MRKSRYQPFRGESFLEAAARSRARASRIQAPVTMKVNGVEVTVTPHDTEEVVREKYRQAVILWNLKRHEAPARNDHGTHAPQYAKRAA